MVVPIPTVSLGNDTILCLRQSLILDVTNPYSSYLWQDNSTNPVFTVNQQGIYWVSVSVNSNCIVSDTINISLEDCQNTGVYIPNSFTPNGDGLNDVFYIKTIAQFSKFNMFIYNRWGQLVFETDNATIGWDGTFNGRQVPVDVYNYKIETIDKESGGKKVYSGRVSVIK
jgi:gliding motility-associated-like protein